MVAKSGEMLYITHVGPFPDVIRLERYRRGHNEPHSKCGRQETGARVRIPFSPPTKRTSIFTCPFCFSVLNKRDSARCVASCRLRREPLRRKAGAPLLRVNSPASLLHEPFLSAIGKNRSFWAVFACFIVYFYTFGTTFHKKCAIICAIICIKKAPAFCASLTLEYFPTISY